MHQSFSLKEIAGGDSSAGIFPEYWTLIDSPVLPAQFSVGLAAHATPLCIPPNPQ
jgi:hypothetical protein